jgi:hypothetical protein
MNTATTTSGTDETWLLADLLASARWPGTVAGTPRIVAGPADGRAVAFDGVRDALRIARNPLAGAARFTVELVFAVASGTVAEQRVVHVQARDSQDRLLLETRAGNPAGTRWYADTIVCSGGRSVILAEAGRCHPAAAWQALAVVCDGHTMRQHVNGDLELTAPCATAAWTEGTVCVGMRDNAITPFRGLIAAVRFSRWARPAAALWTASEPGSWQP